MAKKVDALKASTTLPTITVGEVDIQVLRKPSMLLLSELATMDSGDPDALGAISEFFRATLRENYPQFRRAIMDLDVDGEDDVEALMGYVGEILEGTLGRPGK